MIGASVDVFHFPICEFGSIGRSNVGRVSRRQSRQGERSDWRLAGNSLLRANELIACPVCAENVIRIDLVTESLNVSADGRAAMFLPDAVGLAVQVE